MRTKFAIRTSSVFAEQLATRLAGLSLLVGLAACGPGEAPRDPTKDTVTYRCESGEVFDVFFRAADPTVRVTLQGAEFDLPQVPSDLGIAYSDGSRQLTILLDHANLTGTSLGALSNCIDEDEEGLL